MGLKRSRNFFLGLSIVLSAHVLTAFQITTCRRFRSGAMNVRQSQRVSQLQLASNDSVAPKSSKGRQVNQAVRDMMHIVREKYPVCPGAEWHRLKTYLYQNYERLSLGQVQQVLDYLEELFPDDHDLHVSILQVSPRILAKPVDTFLRPTVEFLKNLYGTEMFTEAIRRKQDLLLIRGLGYNAGPSSTSIPVYLSEQFGLSSTAISKVKLQHPKLFQRPLHKIEAVVSFFGEILHHGNATEQVIKSTTAKLITRDPFVFHLSVHNKLKPQLDYLETACHLNTAEVAKLLVSRSGTVKLLTTSVEQHLKPLIAYLSQIVSSAEGGGDLKRCLLAHPGMLNLALNNIQNKVEYFDSLDPPSFDENGRRVPSIGLAARVMSRAPSVYSLSLTDSIIPKVAFLRGVWGVPVLVNGTDSSDGDGRRLAGLLREAPTILTLNLEGNIQPTCKFYNSTGYFTLDSHWQLLEGGGGFSRSIRGREISVSLFNRLLPRWHFVRSMYENATETLPSPLIPLNILVGATDATFCDVYGVSQEDFENYKEEAIPRLKFSSQFDTWLKTGRRIELD